MTDDTDAGLAPDDTTAAPAPEDNTPAEPTIEDQALMMGWTPEAQFKGDPAKFVSAEDFVRRGKEFLPFLKASNKRMEGELDKASKQIAKLSKTLEDFGEHHSKTAAREYERALKDLQTRQAQAVEANDTTAVQEITQEIVDLSKEVAAKPDTKPGPTVDMAAWKTANPWFDTDDAMTGAAIAIADKLAASGISGEAQLAEVAKRIRSEFPHKFENARRREPAAVESGGAPPRRGKSYSDLPPDAKQTCDSFVRDIKGFTREKYVADYFGGDAR